MKDYTIIRSEEYQQYMKSLCRLASIYVTRIRKQFADQAYEKYQNETIRRLVLAYGEEAERLDEYRLRWFISGASDAANDDNTEGANERWLKDDILNKASAYGEAIKLLFDIN